MASVAKTKQRVNGEDSYFYSLVTPSAPKKKRCCLKCGTEFLSANYANRTCGSCAAQNARASIRASRSI